jgi:starch synthase (maltosyl-transferring)
MVKVLLMESSPTARDWKRLAGQRICIENVHPELDCGRHALKREAGDVLTVQANIFHDGHEAITAELQYRYHGDQNWTAQAMQCVNPGKDLWVGEFLLTKVGECLYTIEAWTDAFETWRHDLHKRIEAGQEVKSELLEGAELVRQVAMQATQVKADHLALLDAAERLRRLDQEAKEVAFSEVLARLASRHGLRVHRTRYSEELVVVVDRAAARFAAWYEMFPRSQATGQARSGTFRDCIKRLPDIQRMGFDVLYLPPIHPIGKTHRKGKNNALVASPDEPGSPWGIGSEHGGHKAVEPGLGTLADFDALVQAAKEHGIEIALDFAIQCSPDHPYVREHPEWFYHRPDGSIKFAENPPKKYQDIFPLNFDCEAWPGLWEEMQSVVLFWIGHGVKTFRVDNPHTKPVPFWEWLIREVKQRHPDVIFLAEAFTRPAMMKQLAKIGFTQSYTYFTWRNTKAELTEYLTELTQTAMAEYFRGNLFANTPDILHAYLQHGGRPAFKVRYLLAATLSPLCGLYSGFELCENIPLHEGSEEYLDSEKYEVRQRDWDAPGNIKGFISSVNRARRENPALQRYRNLRFHPTDSDQILCYSKATADHANAVIVVVNLDPHRTHHGFVHLRLGELGLGPGQAFQVQDVLTGSVWNWHGDRNFVHLDPYQEPGHLLIVRR